MAKDNDQDDEPVQDFDIPEVPRIVRQLAMAAKLRELSNEQLIQAFLKDFDNKYQFPKRVSLRDVLEHPIVEEMLDRLDPNWRKRNRRQ